MMRLSGLSMSRRGVANYNQHKTIYVTSPELTSTGQNIFRDNMQMAVRDKHVLLLFGSLSTGRTVESLAECVKYYGAKISAACAIFSAVRKVGDIDITAVFHDEDIPNYQSYPLHDCPLCKQGIPIDAIVNSFGYSELR